MRGAAGETNIRPVRFSRSRTVAMRASQTLMQTSGGSVSMKNVRAMMIVSLLASLCLALPALATPRFTLPTQQQKQFKSDAERVAYTAWYNEKTDAAKKLAMGKDFLKKFPDSDFAASVKSVGFQLLEYIFKQHLGAFY